MAQPPRTVISATKPTTTTTARKQAVVNDTPLFGKINKWLMIAGGILMGLGMILMAGGRSSNPQVFDYNEVYSAVRITVAPILIIIGILVEIAAIFIQRPVDNTDTVTAS